jgi:hypothetical protein
MCFQKYNGGASTRQAFPFQKKKKSEVKRGDISEAKPSEEHLTGFYSSRVIL